MAIGKRKVWPQGAVVEMVLTHDGKPALGWLAAPCAASRRPL